jgi:adenosine deaminase
MNHLEGRAGAFTEMYRALPKIELHRHLEGSLRFETLRELARVHGLNLPPTAQLREMVQIGPNEPLTFENFLSKFSTLRLFYRSPEIISRITQEAIADAAADNVRYLELRFTPAALSKVQDFPLAEVMDWVIEGARLGEKEYGVTTRLIASINRHESVALAAQVAYLAQERISQGIVGLDLAGNEADFHAESFAKLFQSASEKGLHITAHAGEWGPGENVYHAIERLHAERIGHGIRVLESQSAVDLARRSGVAFEVCVTSNHQSGAVPNLSDHPMSKMLAHGLNVTINTDDPSISRITLGGEYQLVSQELGVELVDLKARILAAARAAFLSETERNRLVNSISQDFDTVVAAHSSV